LRFNFKASNNQAEYEAFIADMKLASEMEAKHLQVKSDSQLVVSQVQGNFQAKDEQLIKYLTKVDLLKQGFNSFDIEHIPREKNERADLLAKLASTKKPGYNQSVIQETVQQPTVEVAEVFCLQAGESWFTPIKAYLEAGLLPEEEDLKKKIIKDSTRYVIMSGQLYWRGESQPHLRCVAKEVCSRQAN
jgi:ribonuclease HI